MRAVKVSIAKVLQGVEEIDRHLKIRINGEVADRLRIMGRVLGKFINEERSYGNLVLDDETETIRAKFFSQNIYAMENIKLGDLVEVVGFIGKFQDEIHLVANEVAIFTDINWELLRKLEIAIPSDDLEKKLLNKIEGLGETTVDALVNEFGDKVTETVKKLLDRGDIYESSPDKYSVVK